ncbi:DUF4192 family protein [Arthrobacter sp. MDT1-48-3]
MSSPASPAPGIPPSPPIAVSSPADILSYVPHALGFLPDESLVVLTTQGRRLGATLRVDLPPDGRDSRAFAEGVVSFLRGDADADGTLLVVYTKQGWPRQALPPRHGLVRVVEAVLEAAGLPVHGGWLVSASAWRDYFCSDDECCPWPGRPLDAVVLSPLNAELIFSGSAFDASASDAVLRAAPSVARRTSSPVHRLRVVEEARARYASGCAGRWTSPAQFQAVSDVWDAVLLRPEALVVDAEPDVAAFLLASIESRTVRDFLLVSACVGSGTARAGVAACGLIDDSGPAGTRADNGAVRGDRVLPDVREATGLRAALRLPASTERGRDPGTGTGRAGRAPAASPPGGGPIVGDAGPVYADVLAGRFTGAIAWDRVDGMTVVLGRLAEVSDGEARAAGLTMSAWFEYARGRGSRAAVYLDAAERAVPGYRLARLLHELLRRGGLPAWARSRSTAWPAGAAGKDPTAVPQHAGTAEQPGR